MIKSIRTRLLVLLLAIVSIIGGFTMVRSYIAAYHEVQELFDAQLAITSRSLQAIVLHNLQAVDYYSAQQILDYPEQVQNRKDEDFEAYQDEHSYERKLVFQVWEAPGRLILHSASAPANPLDEHSMIPGNRGYSDVMINGSKWRIFSLWDPEFQYITQVGEEYAIRNELISKIIEQLIMPSIISIPILALMIWYGIGRGLTPIRNVAKEVTQRESDYLDPIKIDPVPDEILPLVNELNELFSRLNSAMDKERQFTNNAAHELRTPLAALRMQTQVAMRANNDEQRKIALLNILKGVDRATHLVQQMLLLARVVGNADKTKQHPLILHHYAQEILAQQVIKAIEKNITLSLSGDQKGIIHGDPANLDILLNNIINNAINYTPNNGTITIRIDSIEQKLQISVTDTGPGIPPEKHNKVFERYFRVLGTDVDGCGLGLAIAKQCADSLNANIEFKTPANGIGLTVNILFPVILN